MFAGQNIAVGSVVFSDPVDGEIEICIYLEEPWEFEDEEENVKIQGYISAPSGNPAPGLFDWKDYADPDSDSFCITVPENNFYGVHM